MYIFVNFNLNIKMAEKSLKTHKNIFQTQAIIAAHSLYTGDTIWQLNRCIESIWKLSHLHIYQY